MKTAVITAITGGYDKLEEQQATAGADFICYTDNTDIISETWEIRKAKNLFIDNNRNAKIYKIIPELFLPEYDYILWIDGNIQMKKAAPYLIKKYLQTADLALFEHHKRVSIFEEAAICAAIGKDDKNIIDEQIWQYAKDYKLYECPVILRINNHKTSAFNNAWWAQITRHSKRDQLSFSRARDQAQINIQKFDNNILTSDEFERVNHGAYRPQRARDNFTSIIIPFKDQVQYLQFAIESIYKKTANYELILVADKPNKQTKKFLNNLQGIPGKIIYNEKQMGFPYCINQGIKEAKADYLCFLNSDTVVTPGWKEEILSTFEEINDAGIAGPLTSYCGNKSQMIAPLRNKRFAMREDEIDKIPKRLERSYAPCDITGFCYFIKREVLETVGVLDHKTFKLGNGEETELNHRAAQAGYKSYIAAGAYVHHYGNITFLAEGIDQKKYNRKARDEWAKDKRVYFIKNSAIIKHKRKIREGDPMIDKKKITKKQAKVKTPGTVTLKRISAEIFHSTKTGYINPGETRDFNVKIGNDLMADFPKDFKRV